MVNSERLAETFKSLVEIDSVSRDEKAIAEKIIQLVTKMGGKVVIDGSKRKTKSNTGNLIVRFIGNEKATPLLLSAHMDTVEPGNGVKAVYENGLFTSEGSTILGADDKSAIAIMLETIQIFQENNLPHGPVELVLTTCEEIGLKGAKNLDYSLLMSKAGYVLDSADTEGVVIRAPSANNMEFKIFGKAAHAGAHPEKGINAILLAAKAIAGLNIGRIDDETTCNIGSIEGGVATNIVPNFAHIKGEVRSHDDAKLKKVTDQIVSSFENTIKEYKESINGNELPRLETQITGEFTRTHIPEDHFVVKLAQKAAENLGREMTLKRTGGGADANEFFKKGIMTGVIGTGMQDIHTVRESIHISDMVKTVELLVEIIQLNAKEENRI